MKSNEEILDDYRYWAFNHKGEALKKEVILPAMDEARRESAVGFAEWIRIKFYSGNDGTWHEDTAPDISRSYTTSELYSLYVKLINKQP